MFGINEKKSTMTYEIVPVELAVKAMRDSGYKNAAYAIAELIDNSIQAGAASVELLCREVIQSGGQRLRGRIEQIAVLDNGKGMDAVTLRAALQFGNGSYLNNRNGIGRFGMGLPNSSLSQCRKVDVWTWQAGGLPIHTCLDLNEISAGRVREVPAPVERPIDRMWIDAARSFDEKSGTLVVWDGLDRCQWKTAGAIIRNSEYLIGRIYRRFINNGLVRIRMAAFQGNPADGIQIDEFAKANDPCYLMSDTSCPAPWADRPMFELFGEHQWELLVRGRDGNEHLVKVTCSIARREARQGHNPGSLLHGQHAKGNEGVSVVRADRELELQMGWIDRGEPRERWWGVEIEIPPGLDEIFGVTNDKQSARFLADIAVMDLEAYAVAEGFSTAIELITEWERDDDERLVLVKVKSYVDSQLNAMRRRIRAQRESQPVVNSRHDRNSPEQIGTDATRRRQQEGHVGGSDSDEALNEDVRSEVIKSDLINHGFDEPTAESRAKGIVSDNRKYEFVHVDLETSAFFTVRPTGGTLFIQLNTNHPAYENLMTLLEDDVEDANVSQLRERIRKSHDGLKLLLEAWARYEDELPISKKDDARDARADWGRVAREFLRDD